MRGFTLLAAIAFLAALGVQATKWYLASRRYREEAAFHSRLAAFYSERERKHRRDAEIRDYDLDEWKRKGLRLPPPGFPRNHPREEADRCASEAEFELRMKQKYEDAAARPWLPVEPDTIQHKGSDHGRLKSSQPQRSGRADFADFGEKKVRESLSAPVKNNETWRTL